MEINDLYDENSPKLQDFILEQYKIYIESAEKVTQHRMNSNVFFITLNSLLVALLTALKGYLVLFICIVGIVQSIVWFLMINNYKKLNSEKFKIIFEIEKFLPLSLYKEEWKLLRREPNKYKPMSDHESALPFTFILIYLIIAVLAQNISF